MNAFLDLMTIIYDSIYLQLLSALEMIPLLTIDIQFGLGVTTLAVMISSAFTFSLYFFVAFIPINMIYKFTKSLFSVFSL